MTFDLDPALVAQRAAVTKAAAADAVSFASGDAASRAGAVARTSAAMPDRAATVAWAACLEDVAAISGALAVEIAANGMPASSPVSRTWTGFQGADVERARHGLGKSAVGSLSASAVLLGLGRAALDAAIETVRANTPEGSRPEQAQWRLADAATALDAARLLIWRAAGAVGHGERDAAAALSMARLTAVEGAEAAVTAARDAAPAEAWASGTVLDRVARDVATAVLLFGGEAELAAADPLAAAR